jgi:hypothetical protein
MAREATHLVTHILCAQSMDSVQPQPLVRAATVGQKIHRLRQQLRDEKKNSSLVIQGIAATGPDAVKSVKVNILFSLIYPLQRRFRSESSILVHLT